MISTTPAVRRNGRGFAKAFAELEANPLATGVSERRDATGRTIQVGAFGVFLIHYWDDYLVKELRIVRIERFR